MSKKERERERLDTTINIIKKNLNCQSPQSTVYKIMLAYPVFCSICETHYILRRYKHFNISF